MHVPEYKDPETGESTPLDPIQRELYAIFLEQGVHPEDAVVVARHVDSLDPERQIVNWSEIFFSATRSAELLEVSRGWMSSASKNMQKPAWHAQIVQRAGAKFVWRLWSRGRLNALKSGAIT